MTAKDRLLAWLAALPAAERDELARKHAASSALGGAVVRRPDGSVVPIPPLLSPEVLDPALRDSMASDSHALLVGLGKLTAWLMSDSGAAARAALFRPFTPLERAGLAGWRHAERLATARVDFFLDPSGRARALEVNATIPAMQGYSDIIAESFLRVAGEARGLDAAAIESLIAANGRNSDDLRAALGELRARLVAGHVDGGDARAPLRVLIVHRAGDAQLGELEHYARRWSALGDEVRLATPEEIRLDGGRLRAGDFSPELVYRHVFARRLDPASDFAQALLRPDEHCILNPISSHYEVKGMLAFLSAAADPRGGAAAETLARALGLEEGERAAIDRTLPWTRLLTSGPTTSPDGAPLEDLVAAVGADPTRYVIKRSWDYGGKSVFLGPAHDDEAARRAAEVFADAGAGGRLALDWPTLVDLAARDGRDAWVVQEFVSTPPRRHLLATPDGAHWRDWYVDLSIYTNLGAAAVPTGGASRASQSRIVNILGGGGLAPLVRAEVLDRLIG